MESTSNEYITTQNNIAHLFTEMGKLNEAAQVYMDVIQKDVRKFGPEHLVVAEDYNNIGGVLMYSRDFERALKFFELSLTIFNKHNGRSYKEGIILMNIAICLDGLEDSQTAIIKYLEAEEILLMFFNENHPEVARVRENLGYCYFASGKKSDGILMIENALHTYKSIYGDLHQDTVAVAKELKRMKNTK